MKAWSRLRYQLGSLFEFSPRETSAFIALSSISLILVISPFVLRKILQEPMPKITMESMESAPAEKTPPMVEYKIPFSAINPDTIGKQGWIAMGLEDKIAQRIVNYHAKGGHFKTPEDVRKIYDFPTALYDSLKNRMIFPSPKFDGKTASYPKSIAIDFHAEIKLHLNEASAEDFQQIKGLGPTLSKRIVKFRENLGGFHSPQQLYAVYGLDSLVAAKTMDHLVPDELTVKKINPNVLTIEELKKHPLISYYQAKTLKNYIRITGKELTSVDQLKESKAFSMEELKEVIPYLELKESGF